MFLPAGCSRRGELFDEYHGLCVNHFIQSVELRGYITVNIDSRINHKAQEIVVCQYLAQKQRIVFSVLQYLNCIIADSAGCQKTIRSSALFQSVLKGNRRKHDRILPKCIGCNCLFHFFRQPHRQRGQILNGFLF